MRSLFYRTKVRGTSARYEHLYGMTQSRAKTVGFDDFSHPPTVSFFVLYFANSANRESTQFYNAANKIGLSANTRIIRYLLHCIISCFFVLYFVNYKMFLFVNKQVNF